MTGRADSQKYKILIKTVFKAGGSYRDDRTSSGGGLIECVCWDKLTNEVDVFRPPKCPSDVFFPAALGG